MLDGGAGIDTADYAGSAAGGRPSTSWPAQAAAATPQGDTLSGIENVVGSAYDDTLTGDGGGNRLAVAPATMRSRAARADVLDGGAGIDTASYAGSGAAVTVTRQRRGTRAATPPATR